jgi:hypothetical protein
MYILSMLAEAGMIVVQKAKKVLENIAEMIDVMAERISYGFYNDEDR